jgi:hypothetical protein
VRGEAAKLQGGQANVATRGGDAAMRGGGRPAGDVAIGGRWRCKDR